MSFLAILRAGQPTTSVLSVPREASITVAISCFSFWINGVHAYFWGNSVLFRLLLTQGVLAFISDYITLWAIEKKESRTRSLSTKTGEQENVTEKEAMKRKETVMKYNFCYNNNETIEILGEDGSASGVSTTTTPPASPATESVKHRKKNKTKPRGKQGTVEARQRVNSSKSNSNRENSLFDRLLDAIIRYQYFLNKIDRAHAAFLTIWFELIGWHTHWLAVVLTLPIIVIFIGYSRLAVSQREWEYRHAIWHYVATLTIALSYEVITRVERSQNCMSVLNSGIHAVPDTNGGVLQSVHADTYRSRVIHQESAIFDSDSRTMLFGLLPDPFAYIAGNRSPSRLAPYMTGLSTEECMLTSDVAQGSLFGILPPFHPFGVMPAMIVVIVMAF